MFSPNVSDHQHPEPKANGCWVCRRCWAYFSALSFPELVGPRLLSQLQQLMIKKTTLAQIKAGNTNRIMGVARIPVVSARDGKRTVGRNTTWNATTAITFDDPHGPQRIASIKMPKPTSAEPASPALINLALMPINRSSFLHNVSDVRPPEPKANGGSECRFVVPFCLRKSTKHGHV